MKRITQKGESKRKVKPIGEFISDIQKAQKPKERLLQKDLAKKLKIAPRTLSSYRTYIASLSVPSLELGKNDRKPKDEKKFLKKLKAIYEKENKKLPVKKRVKKTRSISKVYNTDQFEEGTKIIDKRKWESIVKDIAKIRLILIRVHLELIGRGENTEQWVTFTLSGKENKAVIKDFKKFNNFIVEEIAGIVMSTMRKYDIKNVLGFEIKEIVFDIRFKKDKK